VRWSGPPRQNREIATVEAALVPVAEAVARLLAEGDFKLVRKCESADCTLWFHDRTKSHHRRWCSMALCGNRAKVAAFRARQKAD
jgi:predicted RNA-binding Zn ribbon-like protein